MSQSPPASPRFEMIRDELEIRRMVDRAAESRVRVDVNLPKIPLEFQGKLAEDSSPQSGIKVELPEDIRKAFAEYTPEQLKALDLEAFFILFLKGQVLLGFQGPAAELAPTSLKLTKPFKAFKIQRRKETRWEVPIGYEMIAEISSPGRYGRVRRKVIDLSPSGLGIQVLNTQESELLKTGLILKDVTLTLQNHVITVDAEVRNQVPMQSSDPDRNGTKIGMRFVRISKKDQDTITSFVAMRLGQLAR